MTTPIRLGFIGCGGHAVSSHAKVAAAMPELYRISKVFDINVGAAKSLLLSVYPWPHDYEFAVTVDELVCDPEVDAVVIATPHKFHLEQAKPVWCMPVFL